MKSTKPAESVVARVIASFFFFFFGAYIGGCCYVCIKLIQDGNYLFLRLNLRSEGGNKSN